MTANRLSGLDGLRGIAALSVLAFHIAGSTGNAFLAVDFFFMLSGYVMARTYEARLSAGLSGFEFLQMRFMRLWPTMFAAGLIAAPLFFYRYGIETWPFVAANLLMIPAFALNRVYPLNGPAWSILFELLANALHGFVLFRLPVRRLALIAVVAFLCLAKFAHEAASMDIGSNPGTLAAGFPRVVFAYTLGVILFRRWQDCPPVRISAPLTFAAMPLFFLASSFSGVHFWLSDLLFVALGCPLLLAGGLQLRRHHRFAAFAGAISFPLYAVHQPVLWCAEWLGVGSIAAAAASLVVAAGMVWAQARVAERRRSVKVPHAARAQVPEQSLVRAG